MSTTETGKGGVPAEIDRSVWLWFATMLLMLVRVTVRTFNLPDSVIAQMRAEAKRSGMPMSEAMLQDTLRLTQILMIVLFVVLCAVWSLFIMKMRAGKAWARSVLTMLGWLSLIFTVPAIISDDPSSVLFYGLTVAVELAAIVLMFRGAGGEHFAVKTNARDEDRLG